MEGSESRLESLCGWPDSRVKAILLYGTAVITARQCCSQASGTQAAPLHIYKD